MHFFECILSFREVEGKGGPQLRSNCDVKSCTVMKFSCPVSKQITLQPERITAHLENLFTKRIISIGDPTLLKIEIHQTTHDLDRLVL